MSQPLEPVDEPFEGDTSHSPGIPTEITSDAALFGRDRVERLVAAEPDTEQGVWFYRRTPEGVRREWAAFRPWILLTHPPVTVLPDCTYSDLEGEGFRVLAEFTSYAAYSEARFRLREAHADQLTYAGGARMALMRTGRTLFQGMTFQDIVRMQFDLETNGLDPAAEDARILLIAVADNRGLLDLIEGDEREILERFVALVRDRDPDVLEGHNLYGFDLPFLIERARRRGVRLGLGRDGSEPRKGQERNYAIAASNTRPFTPVYVYGRHVIDTYLTVQRFDWAKQALTRYGLKECARVYGFAAEDRVELPREEMLNLYRDNPELVRTYARQDVIETARLAELISPVEFYQTQMVPDNYGQVAISGNGDKINSLFVRAYLAAGRAISQLSPSASYEGGYTEVRERGLLHRVVKADVESLYPSLMLTNEIRPSGDTLGIFTPMLRELTRRRFEAKRKAAAALKQGDTGETHTHDETHDYWDGLQGSYKVLINSFYGYLGGPFNFNDFAAAKRVTELGRELVQEVARRIDATGGKVIEIDTDGVYFVAPDAIEGEEAERQYVAKTGEALPEGIRLAFDGRFRAMLSLKTKNYVLVTYEGRRIFKGASLRSRAEERYGRRFMAKSVECLLEEDYDGVAALYAETVEALLKKQVPIEDLARRERITEKTFQSVQKRRAAAVAEGIAVGEHIEVYERADGSLGLLDDYADDVNTRYYVDKLYKFARRLVDAFGNEATFDRYLPKPTAQGLPRKVQETLDLF